MGRLTRRARIRSRKMDLDKLLYEHERMRAQIEEWRPLIAQLKQMLEPVDAPAPEPPRPPKVRRPKPVPGSSADTLELNP